ncbi:MAG: hypothetical protein UT32_C0016G0022 [Parcubacteria group bacterium GW2011_GWC2_39_14]|nr:MAG: hypothetical protein UT32_C0016G0022 [Parcubacteria group bacterium GW2011_GWC2_39_14]KKR55114.1 MAG: hypothetical protein UT91_C0004G0013 [Parcubacteria group bacterium GW2011_GWA2_40_23]
MLTIIKIQGIASGCPERPRNDATRDKKIPPQHVLGGNVDLGYEDFAQAGVSRKNIRPGEDFYVLPAVVKVSDAITSASELGLQENRVRLKIAKRQPIEFAVHVVQQVLDQLHRRSTRLRELVIG